MKNLITRMRTLMRDDSGQDLLEYALLVALIALVAVAAVKNSGQAVNSIFTSVASQLQNAAQAVSGTTADPRIRLVTRVARYVTLARRRHRLAFALAVEDNGPGVPEAIRDRIFYPLVSGREGGSGLGLTLAQTFIAQHGGTIECDSRPGRTVFSILLPLERSSPAAPK